MRKKSGRASSLSGSFLTVHRDTAVYVRVLIESAISSVMVTKHIAVHPRTYKMAGVSQIK